jgi:hypothetical protein
MPWLTSIVDDASAPPDFRQAASAAAHVITGLQFPLESSAACNTTSVWASQAHRFAREQRWRYGLPHNASTLVHLLRSGPPGRGARQQLYRELATATRWQAPRFSPFDFVAEQLIALARTDAWMTQRVSLGL